MFKPIRGTNIVELDGQMLPGIWPFVNENFEFIDVIAVGNKNGIDHKIHLEMLKKRFPRAQFVFNCQNGPYFMNHLKDIWASFSAHMTADWDPVRETSLLMNHSMMVRSMPMDGFFWEPREKKYDFSILTQPRDFVAKRWDRCLRAINKLCSAGLRGIIVSQEGGFPSHPSLTGHSDRLVLREKMPERQFHDAVAVARIGVFPNHIDAFPKHLIETILADKPVLVSHDLLMGKCITTPAFGHAIDFDRGTDLERAAQDMLNKKEEGKRERWLELYGFIPLAKLWANEMNRQFNRNERMVFFMNHIERIQTGKDQIAGIGEWL